MPRLRQRQSEIILTDLRNELPVSLKTNRIAFDATIRRSETSSTFTIELWNLTAARDGLWHKGLHVAVWGGYTEDVYGLVGHGLVEEFDPVWRGPDHAIRLTIAQSDVASSQQVQQDGTVADVRAIGYAKGTRVRTMLIDLARLHGHRMTNPYVIPESQQLAAQETIYPDSARRKFHDMALAYGFRADSTARGTYTLSFIKLPDGEPPSFATLNLSSDRGLIDRPQRTSYGWEARCTLCPDVFLRMPVSINGGPAWPIVGLTHTMQNYGKRWDTTVETEEPGAGI